VHLNQSRVQSLTLLAAPAGSGKTTLLSEWIPQSEQCVCGLSLDDGDNDPVRFWTYVIGGVGRDAQYLGEVIAERLQMKV
jgi:LuxR family maltose regulon positive regulatory protein